MSNENYEISKMLKKQNRNILYIAIFLFLFTLSLTGYTPDRITVERNWAENLIGFIMMFIFVILGWFLGNFINIRHINKKNEKTSKKLEKEEQNNL